MEASYVINEKNRNYNDYADCIDDDMIMIDDDDTVCDDDRDGLTPAEAEAYDEECKVLNEFRMRMRDVLGWKGWQEWCKSYL